MSSSTDTVTIRGGASRLVVGSPDVNGIEAAAPGASIRVIGNGGVTSLGGVPVSKAELADAFQNVQELKVVDSAGNQVGSVTVTDGKAFMELNGEKVLTEAGESIVTQEAGSTAPIAVQHGVWHSIDSASTAVAVAPSSAASLALSMQLLLTPDANLPEGWLTATGGATLEWVGGEPYIVAGYSYIVTLVQVSPTRILANLNMPFAALA